MYLRFSAIDMRADTINSERINGQTARHKRLPAVCFDDTWHNPRLLFGGLVSSGIMAIYTKLKRPYSYLDTCREQWPRSEGMRHEPWFWKYNRIYLIYPISIHYIIHQEFHATVGDGTNMPKIRCFLSDDGPMLQRGPKVTSLVARSSRGRCAQHPHDMRAMSWVTVGWFHEWL
jgi:hypothetical protein